MSDATLHERHAQRRVEAFERRFGQVTLRYAMHAAVPLVIGGPIAHALRINFFQQDPELLPYTAEADVLLSSLCSGTGDSTFEMERETRALLLRGLLREYTHERLREVATLLWLSLDRSAFWPEWGRLAQSQRLALCAILDPAQARRWIGAVRPLLAGGASIEDREWLRAMEEELAWLWSILERPSR
jgi:hypothetical protein